MACPLPPAPPERIALPAETAVVRAPDPAQEVREALRRLAQDLEDGVPLHRVAILYRQADPYAALVRESLELAALPWSALDSRSAAESRPGRALLALLRLRERDFAREAVLAWVTRAGHGRAVGCRRPPHQGRRVRGWCLRRSDEGASTRRWTCPSWAAAAPGSHSRAANVVRGSEEWIERLRRYADERERQGEKLGQDGRDAEADAARHRAAEALRIAAVMAAVARDLRPPRDGSPWEAFVAWAAALHARYLGAPHAWPPAEQPYARDVADVIAGLRDADPFADGRGPTLRLFLDALQGALEGRRRAVGRLGEGVLVGPVQAITGLAFRRVYLLGMTEGGFPPTPAADPFFPNGDDPLGRRAAQRATDREAFLGALAAAEDGRITLFAPDASGGRAAFPSRWLLEVVGALRGQDTYTRDFRALDEAAAPWLRVIRSGEDGVLRASRPADWRTGGSVPPRAGRAPAATWPPTRWRGAPTCRSGPGWRWPAPATAPTSPPSTATWPRWWAAPRASPASSTASARSPPARCRPGRAAHSSTSSRYVLGVEPTEHPEARWTLDALEQGNLIHGILEQFFLTLREQGRPGPAEPYTAADRVLLEQIAAQRFKEPERSGETGHPLIWESRRAATLADLLTFLTEDERWRLAQG